MSTFLELYRLTLPIIGTENLVMGVSLLSIFILGKHQKYRYKTAISFFGVAMIAIAVINFLELCMLTTNESMSNTLAIVVTAASLQLVLFLYAFLSLINNQLVSRLNIFIEFLLVALFTLPPLLVDNVAHPLLFNILFGISTLFYCIKFAISFFLFNKHFRKAQVDIQNSYSEGSAELLNWISNLFYLVMSIGVISIVIPLTNHLVLTLYNTFIFLAYFFIYNSIILHISIFKEIERVLIKVDSSEGPVKTSTPLSVLTPKVPSHFIDDRRRSYDTWILNREYTKPGITIEETAIKLGTNRTTLSMYLNSELAQNFYEWISTLRIEDAKQQLLENPTMSILDIAINVGIEDRSNFDKTFKRIVGISPAMYRKAHFNTLAPLSES